MAVGNIKKNHIKTAAEVFLKLNRLQNCSVRFDVIEIYIIDGKYRINHIESII